MSASNTAVTGEQDVNAASRTGPKGVMLAIYRWGLLVFLAAGVVQIFLAGLGTFRLLHGAGDPALDQLYQPFMLDVVEGHHDTLPIISTFPNA